MLRSLVHFCLNFRIVVLLLAVALLIGGIETARRAPWDVFPEFAPPQVVVQTEAIGLSSQEVEQLVTVPVESALNGISGIKTLRSSSAQGLSVVTAIFRAGTDIFTARQMVSERLLEVAPRLPTMAEPPRLTPLKSATSRLLMLGVTSDRAGPMELRTLADWTLRRRILAVPGVAQVEVFGGEERQYQVLVDPVRLQKYDLTLNEVMAAARNATGFGGAGFLETANQRLPIRQGTQVRSPDDLAAVPVAFPDGIPLTLGRVADVRIGPARKPGDATIDGRPGVLLIVHKQPSANTLRVTRDVEAAVDELRATLPEDIELHTSLFRQASFVERAIANLNVSIAFGCVLVTLVLVVFLFQWRTVVISLTAIPLSLLGAIVVLRAAGASLNTMTLGGLAIALGSVVDDAIVDVENVLRRLRENRRRTDPRPALHVVLDASLEVRSAIVYASFIVVSVFVPAFFLEGIAGTFFRSMGAAYVAAIFTSLLVAMTVTPAMCLWLLARQGRGAATAGGTERAAREPLQLRWLQRGYLGILPLFLRFPRTTTLLAVGAFAAAIAVTPFLGGEFLPEFREANFVVFMAGKPDASLPESTRMGQVVARRLLKIDGIETVAQQTGRAELSEDTWGPNISEIWISLDPRADYDRVREKVRASLEGLPGFDFQVKPFLRERVDEVLTGTTADIAIRVVGTDLGELRRRATRIAAALRDVRGVFDLRVEQVVDVPQVDITLRPRDVARYGLSVGELNDTVQTLLRGTTVGQVHEEDRVFDVVVRTSPALWKQPKEIGALLVDVAPHGPLRQESPIRDPSLQSSSLPLASTLVDGSLVPPRTEKIPLRALAEVSISSGPNVVNREGGQRRILVTCNAEGRDVAGVMGDIRKEIDRLPSLPPGYHLEFGGEYQARQAAVQRLVLLSAGVLVGIFIFLYIDFRSLRLTLLVMLSMPLACTGGVAAMLLAGGEVSVGSLVGLVTVLGIAVRNGILLISHYEHLQRVEGIEFGRKLIFRGARERLAPILMTAMTTGLALLPIVLAGDRPGHEIEHPMAVVIIGGLISSTFLSLVLLPLLYHRVGRVARSSPQTL